MTPEAASQTVFPRRGWRLLLSTAVGGLLLVVSALPFWVPPETAAVYMAALFTAGSGMFLILDGWRRWRLRDAPLVLSDVGLEAPDCGFVPWERIRDESVDNQGDADGVQVMLCFKYTDGEACRIDLSDYRARGAEVLRLLRVYRDRYEARKRP